MLQVFEHLGLPRRKRHRIDDDVAPPQPRNHGLRLHLAAVVARLRDQQYRPPPLRVARFQQPRRIIDRIEDRSAAIVVARLVLRQHIVDAVRAPRKRAHQLRRRAERHHRRLLLRPAAHRLHHRRQPTDVLALLLRRPRTLHQHHQRKRTRLRRILHVYGLHDAVVLDDEMVRLQPIQHSTLRILHQRRHQHQVRLHGDRRSLRLRSLRSRTKSHQQPQPQKEATTSHPRNPHSLHSTSTLYPLLYSTRRTKHFKYRVSASVSTSGWSGAAARVSSNCTRRPTSFDAAVTTSVKSESETWCEQEHVT